MARSVTYYVVSLYNRKQKKGAIHAVAPFVIV